MSKFKKPKFRAKRTQHTAQFNRWEGDNTRIASIREERIDVASRGEIYAPTFRRVDVNWEQEVSTQQTLLKRAQKWLSKIRLIFSLKDTGSQRTE